VGERQRIGSGSRHLTDVPIVIRDPTSALEARTESELVNVMDELTTGRTTFLITHRASTLRRCDIQLTLTQGRVSLHALDLDHIAAMRPLSAVPV
jgi:ATP-binding cassette subfamily B protein